MNLRWNNFNVVTILLVTSISAFICGRISLEYFSSNKASSQVNESKLGTLSDRKSYLQEREKSHGSDSAARANGTASTRLSTMESFLRGENDFERTKQMVEWLSSLPPEEFSTMAQQFRELGLAQTNPNEYRMFISAWAKIDPLAALAHTTSGTEPEMNTSKVLTTWASQDPDAALAWVEANGDKSSMGELYMANVIGGISQTDARRASEMLGKLFPNGVYRNVLDGLLPRLNDLGPGVLDEWLGKLPEGGLKNMATASNASNNFRKNPEEAMKYINQLPPGDTRSAALESIIPLQTQRDPEAAAILIEKHKDEVTIDNVVIDFVSQSSNEFPELAVNQIKHMKDKQLQSLLYQRALSSWIQSDSKTAMEWMKTADLPESVQKFLDGSQ